MFLVRAALGIVRQLRCPFEVSAQGPVLESQSWNELSREKVDLALDVEFSWCDPNAQDGCSEGGSSDRIIWRFAPTECASIR